jgi:cobalamin-dependent methionine synthase I
MMILMAKAVLSLNGATCVTLGTQTPIPEIVEAASSLSIDIVGLSFSIAQPKRTIARALMELRDCLPPSIDIWAGGMGCSRLPKRMPGITKTLTFDDALVALDVHRKAVQC